MKILKTFVKNLFLTFINILDVLLAPISILSLIWFKIVKSTFWKFGNGQMKFSQYLFRSTGTLPITRHYYEPFVRLKNESRISIPIDFNRKEQVDLLASFDFNSELTAIPIEKQHGQSFYYKNETFESGDAEMLYNMVRKFKPKNIVEIGSGYSTLMSLLAIDQNTKEQDSDHCLLTCIEPFENKWLANLPIQLIKEKVEDVSMDLFMNLTENDILFIDSSHIIKPEGDVLHEIFQILPTLNKGVIVHIHDIFTPMHYPMEWVNSNFRFWNEQYLLEAFLMNNDQFKIVCAMNYLRLNFPTELFGCCPILANDKDQRPGSFWIQKIK
ncbi:MAG: class I SAM-dependent methyltransferase [Reichenbachiella sp.]